MIIKVILRHGEFKDIILDETPKNISIDIEILEEE